MRERAPSTTALIVAFARGVAPAVVHGAPRDRLARALLPRPVGLAERGVEALSAVPGGAAAIRAASLGLIDHMAFRTMRIDDALREGLAGGIREVVLLGAGLDARAYRMPELGDAVVLEVDHPATQAYKRKRAAGHAPLAKELRYAEIDFEHGDLGEALAASGHDPSIPTFWIWEGVTMYLARAAQKATLAVVGARSAPGSRLAATYITPSQVTPRAWFARVLLGAIREPMLGRITTEELATLLDEAGFSVRSDAPIGAGIFPSRLVVATRRAPNR